ncbi:alpha- and gamma-adaptin-binding protein p34-like [Neocloeon triangulifer]|uniref:alpha- and gamma-adaptin-binding protein p34-like n=1 Tax=Neocloeon triangulifer TaxID=2078957 RepID=UPI00286F0DA0|nr:alpha- and gamma-adaptin-binding protein p34-like [Neocloeon triangulifer]
MDSSEKPSALVISLTEEDPSHTIRMMLGVENLPEAVILDEDIHAYPLRIDTKYYTAEIQLCSLKSKTIGNKKFSDGVGATVIKFDSEKEKSLEEVSSWLPFIKEMSPEVQILLCEKCLEESEKGISKLEVQRWCVENHFELVELNPDNEEEEEEDLPGLAVTTGIKRVLQAFESHLWPNMQMKDERNRVNASLAAYLNGSAVQENNDPVVELAENLQETHISSMMNRIDQLLGAEEGADEHENLEMAPEMEFANLLTRLNEVKEQAASLPSDQRKMCAEQVVKAFWNAIGGEEDEILDDVMRQCNELIDSD